MDRVMVIAAHSDDEVLGCGGTLALHAQSGDLIRCVFMTATITSRGGSVDLVKEREKAHKILGIAECTVKEFPDQGMDTVGQLELARAVETEVQLFKPTIVYTHNPDDVNADHRATFLACLVACRPWCSPVRLFREFEIPGNNWHRPFVANDYVDIGETMALKLLALRAYKSEIREWPHPRSVENMKRVARNAGEAILCKYAERFNSVRGA
jgi:LmbE family N-acetylglucosaminyl deacetylase